MTDYRRAWHPGGTWFFTVNLLQRRGNDLLAREIELLRAVVTDVRRRHPFHIHGWVVLPDHLHCVIELPEGDTDFTLRWRLIRMGFSKGIPKTERRSAVRIRWNLARPCRQCAFVMARAAVGTPYTVTVAPWVEVTPALFVTVRV